MRFRDKYWFLSNFFPVNIEFEGVIYPSVEHAYVAAKTLDIPARSLLLSLTAGQAKRSGRKLEIRSDWDEIRISVMGRLVAQKFLTNPDLASLLLAIDEPIIEHNDWGDTFWGVCEGIGRNEFGKILERIKIDLVKREKDDPLTRPDVTWEELGTGYIANEPIFDNFESEPE